jgi:hypothetical protein
VSTKCLGWLQIDVAAVGLYVGPLQERRAAAERGLEPQGAVSAVRRGEDTTHGPGRSSSIKERTGVNRCSVVVHGN